MKTKEFIEKVEELGFEVKTYETTYVIFNNGAQVASIDNLIPMQLSNYHREYDKLNNFDKEKLFDLLVEYARTPIDERGDKKRYCLQKKNLEFFETYRYLTIDIENNTFSLDVCAESANTTFKFTQKEIDEIKERFNTDLEEFEQIEVDEWKSQ